MKTAWAEQPTFRNPLTAGIVAQEVGRIRSSGLPESDVLPIVGEVYDADPHDGITGEIWRYRVDANSTAVTEWSLPAAEYAERYHRWLTTQLPAAP